MDISNSQFTILQRIGRYGTDGDLRPFFATMFLTLVVWVYMYARRISFISANKISPNDLAAPGKLAQLSPPAVSNPSDNLRNCSKFR